VGVVLDTTVFIELERAFRNEPTGASGSAGDPIGRAFRRLEAQLGGEEEAAIAAITASELLHGVHRAGETHRVRREAFVESILDAFPVLAFDLLVARVHARIWAQLAESGIDVGAHDRLVAATAMAAGWRVATANVRRFDRIAGLDLTDIQLA
jgi:tRNA(fMet)-specific endonuclease VapC